MRTLNLAEVLLPYGLVADLEDGDLITDVMVIAKVSAADGTTAVQISAPNGCDWIAQRGLLSAAVFIADGQRSGLRGDDDD